MMPGTIYQNSISWLAEHLKTIVEQVRCSRGMSLQTRLDIGNGLGGLSKEQQFIKEVK